ncbi:ArsR/SmtB family transcription factor [Paucibacter sp. B51]|uniref:ArsR/SmtB family transcription factor n=1 Tax=Paucibacter sp. B51 TaxID=2993315 RepID=UPI0022EBAEBC|nr:metalloregulator ArsR/SmtB family transcription factor [Paucibacter sp. B51]
MEAASPSENVRQFSQPPRIAQGLTQAEAGSLVPLATYFKALGEPMRLSILRCLSAQERHVGEIALQCQATPANISRHLSVLQQQGVLLRYTRGARAFYRVRDDAVFDLCTRALGLMSQTSALQQASAHASLDSS